MQATSQNQFYLELALNRISYRIIKQAVVDYTHNPKDLEVITFIKSDYFIRLWDILSESDGEFYRDKILTGGVIKIPKDD